jgi:hypothetical protein
MNFETKSAVLEKIYDIYDHFAGTLNLACRKGCASCCTRNVTLTTLEGQRIIQHMKSPEMKNLFEKLGSESLWKRFQPEMTTNGMARLCIEDASLPEEICDPDWGPCPLLVDEKCPIYPVRPFSCRCMISKKSCQQTGYAHMDEFLLTVNNVFLQYIEQVDQGGCFGNLTDVLLLLESRKGQKNCLEGSLDCKVNGLIPNEPIKALMVPPEHRLKIQPLLNSLQKIDVSGQPSLTN